MVIKTDTQIETPRLSLSLLTVPDAADLYRVTHSPATLQILSFLNPDFGIDDAEDLINQNRNEVSPLGIWRREDNTLIGYFAVHWNQEPIQDQVDVGYWIGENFQGCGYVSEALQYVIAYLKETLPNIQIFAGCNVDNPTSFHVLSKQGFKQIDLDVSLGRIRLALL